MLDRRCAVWRENLALWREHAAPASTKHRCGPAELVPPGSALGAGNLARTRVLRRDSTDAGLALARAGLRPLVLNMADVRRPGGCVAAGGGMQEESLFRRSNYHRSLAPAFYPINADEAVYSPGVLVFRAGEEAGFARAEPEALAFVACPGVSMPARDRLGDADAEALARKVRLILRVAREHGHDALVLGALGCGAFGCPAAHVARVFRAEIAACAHAFARVEFAVLGANAAAFEAAFGAETQNLGAL